MWLNGTNLPFTLAPLVFIPISVCILKEKSKGVASFGSDFKSPLGVKTKISLAYRLSLNCSTNSTALESGFSITS